MSCHLSDSQRQKELCSLPILHMAFKGLCQGSSAASLLKKRGRISAWRRQAPWVRCGRGLSSWTSPPAQTCSLVSVCPCPRRKLEGSLQALVQSFSCYLRFRGFFSSSILFTISRLNIPISISLFLDFLLFLPTSAFVSPKG